MAFGDLDEERKIVLQAIADALKVRESLGGVITKPRSEFAIEYANAIKAGYQEFFKDRK